MNTDWLECMNLSFCKLMKFKPYSFFNDYIYIYCNLSQTAVFLWPYCVSRGNPPVQPGDHRLFLCDLVTTEYSYTIKEVSAKTFYLGFFFLPTVVTAEPLSLLLSHITESEIEV